MNERVLQRFLLIGCIFLLVGGVIGLLMADWSGRAPGDYETQVGGLRLESGKYDDALEQFNAALDREPNHRGAMMGRALVFVQTEQYDQALTELTNLIDFLETTLNWEGDPTGVGVLAAAYANRGIIHDREARFEKALEDYISALRVDDGAVSGPGLFYKILHDAQPSTVRDRARYIWKELQKPEEERVMHDPSKDDRQRLYKP